MRKRSRSGSGSDDAERNVVRARTAQRSPDAAQKRRHDWPGEPPHLLRKGSTDHLLRRTESLQLYASPSPLTRSPVEQSTDWGMDVDDEARPDRRMAVLTSRRHLSLNSVTRRRRACSTSVRSRRICTRTPARPRRSSTAIRISTAPSTHLSSPGRPCACTRRRRRPWSSTRRRPRRRRHTTRWAVLDPSQARATRWASAPTVCAVRIGAWAPCARR